MKPLLIALPQMELVGTVVRTKRDADGGGGFEVASLIRSPLKERHDIARAIVALPDLLEALAEAEWNGLEGSPWMKKAKAALEKAGAR